LVPRGKNLLGYPWKKTLLPPAWKNPSDAHGQDQSISESIMARWMCATCINKRCVHSRKRSSWLNTELI